MDPTFRSQTFISDDDVSFQLEDNLFIFAFKRADTGVYHRNIESQQGKTYLIYCGQQVHFQKQSYIRFFNVNITNSQDLALKDYNCFDFSNLKNYYIEMLRYPILNIRMPQNCAEPSQIEGHINLGNGIIQFKLYTKQYNTTSKEFQ
ncbi:hypothetical protein ABPG73_019509 [Tetrahymena malaccensis]